MKRRGHAFGAALAVCCLLGVMSGLASPGKAEHSATAPQHTASPSFHLVQIRSGDTLEEVLLGAGASPVDAALVAKALRKSKSFDPRDLMPGQQVAIRFEPTPSNARTVTGASIELSKGRYVEVTRTKAGGYAAKRTKQALAASAASHPASATAKPAQTASAPAKPARTASTPAKAARVAAPSTNAAEGKTVRIKRGDTLAALLRAQRIESNDASRALKALGDRVDVRALKIGQEVVIVPGPRAGKSQRLARLALKLGDGGVAEVVRRDDGSFAAPGAPAPTVKTATVSAPPEPAKVKQPASPIDAAAPTEAPATEPREAERAPSEEVVALNKGGTLHSLLKARGYRAGDVAAAAKATALSIDPTTLRWGQQIRLSFVREADGSKRLDGLAIERADQPPLVIARRGDGEFGPLSPLGRSDAIGAADAPSDLNAEAAAEEAASDGSSEGAAIYIEEQAAPRDAAYRVVVQPGDSLMNLLLREGIDANEIDQAVRSLRKIYNPRRLREGQLLALLTDIDSTGGLHLSALSIALSERRHVEVRRGSGAAFKASFVRAPSFADRLPPEGVEMLYAGYPALAQVDVASLALNGRSTAQDADEEPEGWSVLSWLGGVGDALGRTGAAEAAAIDLAPEPKPNRALDLDERATTIAEDSRFRHVEIAKGDTLVSALNRGGVGAAEAEAVAAAFKKIHSPRRLQVGQTLLLSFEPMPIPMSTNQANDAGDGEAGLLLRRVSLSVGPDRDIVVERRGNDRFSAREVERPLVRSVYKATGEISSSFYESALAAGLSMDVLTQMVQLFSYDVDFQRGLQPGDEFEVLFERTENDRGDVVEQGTVLFAALTVSGEQLAFYRFEPPDGPVDYFDRNGNSVRKALLRTPIDGARISSGFGMRKHPILGFSKKHKGVDFSAPPGTPIYAAGDGVIEKIGWFSSYGKYVRIKHSETYKTAYAHLKGYARGMKVGTKVRQGQVIGYVGTTGRSTGPHLHYEVMKRDSQVNPNDTKLPVGKQLAGKQLARFKTEIDSYRVMFAQAGTVGTRLARNALSIQRNN